MDQLTKIWLKFFPMDQIGNEVGIGLDNSWCQWGDKPYIWTNDDMASRLIIYMGRPTSVS